MFDSENEMEKASKSSGRRTFLLASGAAIAGLAWWRFDGSVSAANTPKLVKIVEFTNAGERKDIASVPMVHKSEAEWKQQLSRDSFEVTRHADTERAFTGELLNVMTKASFAASVATRRFSAPRLNSNRTQVGRAFGSRSRKRISSRSMTIVSGWSALQSHAADAKRTLDTCSTTVRSRQACVTV